MALSELNRMPHCKEAFFQSKTFILLFLQDKEPKLVLTMSRAPFHFTIFQNRKKFCSTPFELGNRIL